MIFPSPNPLRLVHLGLLGASLFLVSFAVDLFPAPPIRHALLLEGIVFFILLTAGSLLILLSQSRLKDGIARELWLEDQLAVARKFIEATWLTAIQTLLYLIIFLVAVANLAAHFKIPGSSFFLIFSVNSIATLKTTLYKPLSSTRSSRIDWSTTRPIHSDNWGQPVH